jgi:hypothetical protein
VKWLTRIALLLQLATGAHWTIYLAMIEGRGGLEVLGALVVVYAVQLPGFLIGLWAWWKYPHHRVIASWLLVLPVAFLFLPAIVKSLAGGRLTSGHLRGLWMWACVLGVVACFAVPRKIAALLPTFLFQSRVLNGLVLLVPASAWLITGGLAGRVFGFEALDLPRAFDRDETALAVGAVLAMLGGFLAIGMTSLFSAAWGWLGMFSGAEAACRKLHITQLVVAVPGIALGTYTLVLLANRQA